MEELQRKLSQRFEQVKPRKVRFKLASSYSGRVLKHVYEDGQELDSPAEKYPHSFIHATMPPGHLEEGQLYGFQDHPPLGRDPPPPGLIAQRINVYRGGGGGGGGGADLRPPTHSDAAEPSAKSEVLDFGKIIIYTSNLRIIRAPPEREEPVRAEPVRPPPPRGVEQRAPPGREQGRRSRRTRAAQEDESSSRPQRQLMDASSCQRCGGTGSAPCSRCHGGKLSMLSNRFNESISALRCLACYPHGRELCPACTHH